jgi:hypothetical protein
MQSAAASSKRGRSSQIGRSLREDEIGFVRPPGGFDDTVQASYFDLTVLKNFGARLTRFSPSADTSGRGCMK